MNQLTRQLGYRYFVDFHVRVKEPMWLDFIAIEDAPYRADLWIYEVEL